MSRIALHRFVFSCLLLATLTPFHCSWAEDVVVDLTGRWKFAIDPMELGEERGWNTVPESWDRKNWLDFGGWDHVEVPHDFLTDRRYEWTGVAWYRKSVKAPELGPDAVYRLQFDRVARNCRVWINGELAGTHTGGNSPFEFDVTKHMQPGKYSHLAIEVDNRWAVGQIPGGRLGKGPKHQLYPWWNYGGLLKAARLVVSPAVYVAEQKIDAEPELPKDGTKGAAQVTATMKLRNASSIAREVAVVGEMIKDTRQLGTANQKVLVPANTTKTVVLQSQIPKEHVELWSPTSPSLYSYNVKVTRTDAEQVHTHQTSFGIRKVAVADGKFLVNGEPVRMAGANRAEGHPVHGGLEPPELIELDMGLMQQAHLRFHRLQHYPLSSDMLDWADKNGMLVILETPCWGLGPKELSDERYLENFEHQFREMIQSSQNHPCVVGWSVGNEYESWTPEGVAWTRKFAALAKELDPSRPTTFAALGYAFPKKGATNDSSSMHWVDFISINYYMSGKAAGQQLDRIHQTWPDKPLFISEFGKRADSAEPEQRIRHFRETLEEVRKREFVMGLSYWSFNDYRSRYPGTNLNGYRPWGIVDPDRKPRPLYAVMQQELTPASLAVMGTQPSRVRVTSKGDFPRLKLAGLQVQALAGARIMSKIDVPTLSAGQSKDLELEIESDITAFRLVDSQGTIFAETPVNSRIAAQP